MLDNSAKLHEEIQETVDVLGGLIEPSAVEKDIYVTRLIHVLSGFNHEYYHLVFQGGTCLAKAHHIIPRMSEDCDFRIETKLFKEIGQNVKRKQLRDFRREIIGLLSENGLQIDPNKIIVRDEGRFMNMQIVYEAKYPQLKALKPFLSVDFFLTDVKTQVERLPVTTLVREILGESVNHPEKDIDCISVAETAAEKWIGLTRRIATIKYRKYYEDTSLVRHLYDLYKINETGLLTDEAAKLIPSLLQLETKKFKTHNVAYSREPSAEIQKALCLLRTDEKWRGYWKQFILAMVFEKNPPKYEAALGNLEEFSKICLAEIGANIF